MTDLLTHLSHHDDMLSELLTHLSLAALHSLSCLSRHLYSTIWLFVPSLIFVHPLSEHQLKFYLHKTLPRLQSLSFPLLPLIPEAGLQLLSLKSSLTSLTLRSFSNPASHLNLTHGLSY